MTDPSSRSKDEIEANSVDLELFRLIQRSLANAKNRRISSDRRNRWETAEAGLRSARVHIRALMHGTDLESTS